MAKTLYHTQSENCCGYCHYHHCCLTVKQMHRKECLQKHCPHLVKYQQHPFWVQREKKKQKRRDKKERLEQYITGIYSTAAVEMGAVV